MLSPSLFLPYLLIALVVTAVAARRARTPSRKRWITIGLLAFFIAFAHIDDILGGIEHRWLCHKEAGFFVYKTAKLPPELYDANGKPRFMTNLEPNKKMLEPFLRFQKSDITQFSRLPLIIDKYHVRVIDARNGDLLGENIDFARWPSTFLPTISHEGATGCFAGQDEVKMWHDWYKELLSLI
jgi:hypothetical protein